MEVWLDLELRADIDDYITLLYAIETNKNITELSIVNPSINELKLFKYVKEKYNLTFEYLENLGLEFKWVSKFLQNKISEKELTENLNKEIYQYARRQETWFKRYKNYR